MIVLAYDHRAFELMKHIKAYFKENKMEYVEFASKDYDPLDSYADFAKQANEYILTHNGSIGVYSCRSGIGVDMKANRSKGIRAGLCVNNEFVKLARNDDNINVLVIPAGFVSKEQAIEMINTFITTPFEGGRHLPRLKKLDE